MLTIRDAQLYVFQEAINRRAVLPLMQERLASMGLLRADDPAAGARVLADMNEAQALGLRGEPELAQYASYGLTFPGWQSRPELAAILARPGLDPERRLALIHEALSAL